MLIRKHCGLSLLQMKILRIVYFKTLNTHTDSQLIENNSLKFEFLMCLFLCVSVMYLCGNVSVSLGFVYAGLCIHEL